MNTWNFFDRITCLTTSDTEYIIAETELHSAGIEKVIRYNAIESIGPHQSFNLSTYKILQDFYDSGDNSILFFEDDIELRRTELLSVVLRHLPKDYDVFYLGCNIRDERAERVNQYIYRVKEAWCTHAVAYTRNVVKFILDNHPGESEMMFDTWLSGQHNWNKYVCKPMLAFQRPRKSGIWNELVDYNGIFKDSEKKCV